MTLRRTPAGFDSMDHVLDVMVAPDCSRWQWKDEDELAYAVEHGWCTGEQAADVHAEGERAIAKMCAGETPCNDGWEHWQPDPGWDIPAFPRGWDELTTDGWPPARLNQGIQVAPSWLK